jgi:hypothetical protein
MDGLLVRALDSKAGGCRRPSDARVEQGQIMQFGGAADKSNGCELSIARCEHRRTSIEDPLVIPHRWSGAGEGHGCMTNA